MTTQPEGDVLPFKMTRAQRRSAVEKLYITEQTNEWDNVRLFRAKRVAVTPEPKAERAPKTRPCPTCGGTMKVPKPPKVKPEPQKRWWLYYGPGRMTGGFLTKQAAMKFYLGGGR